MLGGASYLLGDREHVGQIGGAVLLGRRTNGHEHHVSPADAVRQARREVEPVRSIALQQIGQARLEKGHLARAQLGKLSLVYVDAHDVGARISEAGARYQPYVSRTNDCDLHSTARTQTLALCRILCRIFPWKVVSWPGAWGLIGWPVAELAAGTRFRQGRLSDKIMPVMSALLATLLLFCVACSGPGAHEQSRVPTPDQKPPARPTRTALRREPVSAPTPGPISQSLVLAAAGDVNLGRSCGQRLLADSSYDPLRGVAPIWANADLRFVNLESALSEQHGETQSPRHGLVFTGPPVGADALARAGIGIVSTANNHAWDYASRGLLETLQNLGTALASHMPEPAPTEADAYRPAIVHVNGLSVAFFAVTQIWNLGVFSEEEARHHVAWADFSRLRKALLKARAESDFVVVSYHGGREYSDVPLPKTRAFVAEARDEPGRRQ